MITVPVFNKERLLQDLTAWARMVALQYNSMTAGHIASVLSSTSYPTTGTHQKGDIVRNSNPSELGTTGSKYVIDGWICTVAGTPGTWVQMRCLTGN